MWEDYQARHMEMGLDKEETEESGNNNDNDDDDDDTM
jgi:hypothetical protein